MNRLFVRVFLGFWLATLLALVVGQQVAHYVSREAPRQNALREQHEQGRQFVRNFSRRYHRQAESEWRPWLEAQNTGFNWLLHRPGGEDISHNFSFEPDLQPLLERRPKHYPPRPLDYKGSLIHIKVLRARGSSQRAYLIIAVKKPNALAVAMFQQHLWLRLLLALLATGALSYWMVRRYTQPIEALRKATHALAGGDLTVRLDETDSVDDLNALRRDFNRMAEQLEAARSRQRTLIHDVSHELRTPLARIQAALALAGRREGDSPELARILEESEYLNRLIDQLLQEPEQELELSDTLIVNDLLASLVSQNQLEADGRHITLHLETVSEEIWIQANTHALRMAIENVLRNAIRHSPANDVVTVSLALTKSGDIAIRIRDRGDGVPDDALDKVFLPFYRLDASRQRSSGGHGLGLAICQRIITSHGGSATARNALPGLEVEMQLPASLRVSPL